MVMIYKNILNYLRIIYRNIFVDYEFSKQSEEGISKIGYKEYVGGDYDRIGRALFEALVNKFNLEKNDIFLDIGCGSLRVGKFLINYLEEGCYLGIEPEKKLVDLAISEEKINLERNPEFCHNYNFDFKFSKEPNYIFANSVFTHLNFKDINKCFQKLENFTKDNCVFFATFSTTPVKLFLPFKSHSHRAFNYTYEQIKKFGLSNNFVNCFYLGQNWGHPRKQHMFCYFKNESFSKDFIKNFKHDFIKKI